MVDFFDQFFGSLDSLPNIFDLLFANNPFNMPNMSNLAMDLTQLFMEMGNLGLLMLDLGGVLDLLDLMSDLGGLVVEMSQYFDLVLLLVMDNLSNQLSSPLNSLLNFSDLSYLGSMAD